MVHIGNIMQFFLPSDILLNGPSKFNTSCEILILRHLLIGPSAWSWLSKYWIENMVLSDVWASLTTNMHKTDSNQNLKKIGAYYMVFFILLEQ